MTVTIGERDYVSDNWSLGGFQLTAALPLELGAVVVGTLRVDGSEGFAFTASVVRHEGDTFGFHFQELSPQAMTKLDRALARRLVTRRRPS